MKVKQLYSNSKFPTLRILYTIFNYIFLYLYVGEESWKIWLPVFGWFVCFRKYRAQLFAVYIVFKKGLSVNFSVCDSYALFRGYSDSGLKFNKASGSFRPWHKLMLLRFCRRKVALLCCFILRFPRLLHLKN